MTPEQQARLDTLSLHLMELPIEDKIEVMLYPAQIGIGPGQRPSSYIGLCWLQYVHKTDPILYKELDEIPSQLNELSLRFGRNHTDILPAEMLEFIDAAARRIDLHLAMSHLDDH